MHQHLYHHSGMFAQDEVMSMKQVFPSHAAREELPKALHRFREEGTTAEPLFFGAHRRAEAVMIPFDLYSQLLPAIEEVKIAQLVRQRTLAGPATPLSELAEHLDLNPTDYV